MRTFPTVLQMFLEGWRNTIVGPHLSCMFVVPAQLPVRITLIVEPKWFSDM